MNLEIENKFQLHPNAQLKFTSRTTQHLLERKIAALCAALKIKIGTRTEEVVEDHYYDDEQMSLRRHKLSLRLRQKNGQTLFTIKLNGHVSTDESLLIRDEYEAPLTAASLPTSEVIADILQKAFGMTVAHGKLNEILSIQNRRANLPLEADKCKAILSLDQFTYSKNGNYSDTVFLIEIEACTDRATFDASSDLASLRLLIRDVLECSPIDQSKLDEGLKWIRDPVSPRTVHTVIFDLIEYSKLSLPEQKRAIQQLNRHCKQALAEVFRGQDSPLVYIPTGDGMLIIFERHPGKIIPFLSLLQARTKRISDACPFRCGLHTGQVFTYTDINDNTNFAGDGINVAQRVMALGGPYHILATESAFESMGRIDAEAERVFHDIGQHKVKHNISFRLYNVFGPELSLGNQTLIQTTQ